MRFWPRRTTRIGIELDGRRFRAAQFVHDRSGSALHAHAEALLPEACDDRTTAGLIRGLLERRGFEGLEVCVGVPINALQSDLVDCAAADGPAPLESLKLMFARATRCTPEQLEVGYWQGAESSRSAFAVALTHERAAKIAAPLEQAGLDIAAMGCAASALAEVVRRLEVHPGDVTAVLRTGWERNLFILLHGQEVLYQRAMDTPGFHADIEVDDPAVRRSVSALADEVNTTVDCVPRTFPGIQVDRVLVSGELAEEESLSELLRQRLDRFEVMCIGGFAPAGSRFDVAAGLAMAEVEG